MESYLSHQHLQSTKKGTVASFANADQKKFPVHGYDIRVASTSLSLFNSDD